MTTDPRFQVRYREGYYVVIDTESGDVAPAPLNHYKRYRDGYLWLSAALFAANDLNIGREVQS